MRHRGRVRYQRRLIMKLRTLCFPYPIFQTTYYTVTMVKKGEKYNSESHGSGSEGHHEWYPYQNGVV
jgi:hypothetical protein